jgi:hypothetical protein
MKEIHKHIRFHNNFKQKRTTILEFYIHKFNGNKPQIELDTSWNEAEENGNKTKSKENKINKK